MPSDTEISRMFTRVVPSERIRDRVLSMEFVQSASNDHVTVLPSSSAVMGFQHAGRVRASDGFLSTAGVTGIQQASQRYGYEGHTTSLLVRFTPQGAACLGVPASEIAARSVALDAVLPSAWVRETQSRFLDARTDTERVAAIESLLARLPFARDALVERAIQMLSATEGEAARIAHVARTLSMSERQLERRFLDRVGITPKRFARLRRFEHALERVRAGHSLAAAALHAGYSDQSHFQRDFRAFTGHAPAAFLRASR